MNKDNILYQGDLFQVIRRIKKYSIGGEVNQEIDLKYELVRRPPGVRAIICKDEQILLNKEFRYELNDWDYRLPGGKVFDTYREYDEACNNQLLQKNIISKLKSEIREEADIIVNDYNLFYLSHNGLTIEWDLYYFVVNDYSIDDDFYKTNFKKNEYEYIQHCWVDFPSIQNLIIEGKISEDRSIGVILKYIFMLNKQSF